MGALRSLTEQRWEPSPAEWQEIDERTQGSQGPEMLRVLLAMSGGRRTIRASLAEIATASSLRIAQVPTGLYDLEMVGVLKWWPPGSLKWAKGQVYRFRVGLWEVEPSPDGFFRVRREMWRPRAVCSCCEGAGICPRCGGSGREARAVAGRRLP